MTMLVFYLLAFFLLVSTTCSSPAVLLKMEKKAAPYVIGGESGLAALRMAEYQRTPERNNITLKGNIPVLGVYYVNLTIGGQTIAVQVDTGSSNLAVPLHGCRNCHSYAYYSVTKSKHGKYLSCLSSACNCSSSSCYHCPSSGRYCSAQLPAACGFHIRYGSGAIEGPVVEDFINLGGLRAYLAFGGMLNSTPQFEPSPVSGIMGMAYKNLACSPNTFEPVFDALVNQANISNIFSLCLNRSGGRLTLGGIDPSINATDITYVPLNLANPPTYYRVNLGGSIVVNASKLALPEFDVGIVDSGTTLLVLTPNSFKTLKNYMETNYCHIRGLCDLHSWWTSNQTGLNPCTKANASELKAFPNITITVGGGVNITLTSEDYMYPYTHHGESYHCLGIMSSKGLSSLGLQAILGDVVIRKHVVVFDRAHERIGFAPSLRHCM